MAYEKQDMEGELWINHKREKDTHPNMKGTIRVGGVEYWLSAWTKTKQDGEKWLSLSVKAKEPSKEPAKPAEPKHEKPDELPF